MIYPITYIFFHTICVIPGLGCLVNDNSFAVPTLRIL